MDYSSRRGESDGGGPFLTKPVGLTSSVPPSSGQKRRRVDDNAGFGANGVEGNRNIPVALLLPDWLAGAIIGKGGATIRELEKTTGAKVVLQRNTLDCADYPRAFQATADALGCSSPVNLEKVACILGSTPECQLEAINRLLPHFSTVVHSRIVAMLLIPQRSVGCLVGTRGKNIEELSKNSGCHVQMVEGRITATGDRCICISGTEVEHVGKGAGLILQQLRDLVASGRLYHRDFENIIQMSNTQFSSRDPPYGRDISYNRQGGMNGTHPMVTSNHGMGTPGGGSSVSGVHSNAEYAQASDSYPPTQMGNLRGINLGCSMFVQNSENFANYCQKTNICLIIPRTLAAWVVGQGGSHVRSIREETGSNIQVLDDYNGVTHQISQLIYNATFRSRRGDIVGDHGSIDGEAVKDRFLLVSGSMRSLCGAFLRLMLPLQEKQIQNNQELRILVAARVVTLVIGTRGSSIREIVSVSGAQVTVSRSPDMQEEEGENGFRSSEESRQQRIIYVKGDLASRVVALAMIWQRILYAEIPEANISNPRPTFVCLPSLISDLVSASVDVSSINLPFYLHQQLQQKQDHKQMHLSQHSAPIGHHPLQHQYGGGSLPVTDQVGGSSANPNAWEQMQSATPTPMPPDFGSGPAVLQSSQMPKQPLPNFEQMESVFKEFCSRFIPRNQLHVCSEKNTIRLVVSKSHGDILLLREPQQSQQQRYAGGIQQPTMCNALDKISELTGCQLRCFMTTMPPTPVDPVAQQQMVLLITGPAVANSLAVLLLQARLLHI